MAFAAIPSCFHDYTLYIVVHSLHGVCDITCHVASRSTLHGDTKENGRYKDTCRGRLMVRLVAYSMDQTLLHGFMGHFMLYIVVHPVGQVLHEVSHGTLHGAYHDTPRDVTLV